MYLWFDMVWYNKCGRFNCLLFLVRSNQTNSFWYQDIENVAEDFIYVLLD